MRHGLLQLASIRFPFVTRFDDFVNDCGLDGFVSIVFIIHAQEVSVIEESQTNPQIWEIFCSWVLHTSRSGLYDSHLTDLCRPIFSSTEYGRRGLALQWDNSYMEDQTARIAAVLFC